MFFLKSLIEINNNIQNIVLTNIIINIIKYITFSQLKENNKIISLKKFKEGGKLKLIPQITIKKLRKYNEKETDLERNTLRVKVRKYSVLK